MQVVQIGDQPPQFSDAGLSNEAADVGSVPVCVAFVPELFVTTLVHFPPLVKEGPEPFEIRRGWVAHVPHVVVYQVASAGKVFGLTSPHSILREERSVLFGKFEKSPDSMASFALVKHSAQRDYRVGLDGTQGHNPEASVPVKRVEDFSTRACGSVNGPPNVEALD
jgi:hypothetical protein